MEYDRKAQLPELTSLRFFAAAYVVVIHAFDRPTEQSTIFERIVHKGYLGVDFFFILSGFILIHVYLHDYRSGRFSHIDFLVNRFARVYPLHIVMLAVFVAVYSLAAQLGLTTNEVGMNWADLPWHILALHAWGLTAGHSWNFPSWSISAEAFAYYLFPLYLMAAVSLRPATGLLMAVGLFIAAYATTAALGYKLTGLMYDFGIVRIAFEFLLGVYLYTFFERWRPSAAVIGPTLILLLCGLFAGLVAGMPDLVTVLLFALIIYLVGCLSVANRPTLLRNRALVYLGEISYATYMVHYLVLLLAKKGFDRVFHVPPDQPMLWSTFIPAIVTIYALSIALHHTVERPARIWIRGTMKAQMERRTI